MDKACESCKSYKTISKKTERMASANRSVFHSIPFINFHTKAIASSARTEHPHVPGPRLLFQSGTFKRCRGTRIGAYTFWALLIRNIKNRRYACESPYRRFFSFINETAILFPGKWESTFTAPGALSWRLPFCRPFQAGLCGQSTSHTAGRRCSWRNSNRSRCRPSSAARTS